MIVTAIKCDHCGKVVQEADVPESWATIGAIVRIRGAPQSTNTPKGKSFKERRDALAARVPVTHICPDCIETILTGKISLKLGQ